MVRALFLKAGCLLVQSLFVVGFTLAGLSHVVADVAVENTALARFTVDAKVDNAILSQLEVRLSCTGATPVQQQAVIKFDGSHEFTATLEGAGGVSCTVAALLPENQDVSYVGDGGSVIELDGQGCHFIGVAAGHSNFCQVHVKKEATRLTVYKKWIGGTVDVPNVNIHLICNQELQGNPKWINSDIPQTWELEISDVNGIRCGVHEVELDTFRADQSDCSNLLMLPGADEECTLVNTRVVKRIEVLNRYGLAAMILVMLAAGLLAIKRMVG
jgi:hypothetical protein